MVGPSSVAVMLDPVRTRRVNALVSIKRQSSSAVGVPLHCSSCDITIPLSIRIASARDTECRLPLLAPLRCATRTRPQLASLAAERPRRSLPLSSPGHLRTAALCSRRPLLRSPASAYPAASPLNVLNLCKVLMFGSEVWGCGFPMRQFPTGE